MRTKFAILILMGLILVLNNFCKKDVNCDFPKYSPSPVTYVEGANIAQINQEISLTVSSHGASGCSYPSDAQIKETISGFSRTVQILSKSNSCDTVCPAVIIAVTSIYKFKASQAGVYTLKFLSYNNGFVEHVITVQ